MMWRFLVAFLFGLGVALPAVAQNTAKLMTAENHVQGSGVGQVWEIGFYGFYTGTAPTSATGTWNGCGGGAAKISRFDTDQSDPNHSLRAGVCLVNAHEPSTLGTCTLTITTNLGETSTSPSLAFTAATTGPEVVSQVHNAPGWIHSPTMIPTAPAQSATPRR